MSLSRRQLLGSAALAGGALLMARQTAIGQTAPARTAPTSPESPLGGGGYVPVTVPNGTKLPYRMVDGVKVFHLVAEEVDHEFLPGLKAYCWGYNGTVHGPVIEAVEGDRVRIFVTNKLGAPTTVHWHGLILPSGMDGVGGLNQKAIHTGETYMYEFDLVQHGTFMYHSHHDEMTQMGMGMVGMFVVHPKDAGHSRPDRDFAMMVHEWHIGVGVARPDTNEMSDFNVLTFNARAFPGTDSLVVRKGEKVRIRLGNLSAMNHHPVHLHGYNFKVTETDGGVIPVEGQWPQTTVLVPVGSTRTIEFVADYTGDWAMHCHMTHHVMNQMGHGIPNMIGIDKTGIDEMVRPLLPDYMTMGEHGMGDMGEMGMPVPPNSVPMVGGDGPFGYITMGGMFTILKVRDGITSYEDPGWYDAPEGTVSSLASADALAHNGIDAPAVVSPARVVYTCPMHPEVITDDPDMRCPKCRMKLVPKK